MRQRFINLQELPLTPEELLKQRTETEAELTAATQEQADRYEEVSSAMDDIEKAFVAHDAVNVVADEVEKTIEVGGMPAEAANAVTAAVEALRINLGFRKNTSPALESFGKGDDRVTATKVALEGLKDTAAKIWEAIKKAFAKMVEWFKSLFDARQRKETARRKRIEETLQEIKDLRDSMSAQPAQTEQRGKRKWKPETLVNGHPPTASDFEQQLYMNRNLTKWVEELGQATIATVKDLEQSLKAGETEGSIWNAEHSLGSILKRIPHGTVHESNGELTIEVSCHMGGGKIIGKSHGSKERSYLNFSYDKSGAGQESVEGDGLLFQESLQLLGKCASNPTTQAVSSAITAAIVKTNELILSAAKNRDSDERVASAKTVLYVIQSLLRTTSSALHAVSDLNNNTDLAICSASI